MNWIEKCRINRNEVRNNMNPVKTEEGKKVKLKNIENARKVKEK